MKPETASLIRGMSHPRSNIVAVHFDGPMLADMTAAKLALDNPGPVPRYGSCKCGRKVFGLCQTCGMIAT